MKRYLTRRLLLLLPVLMGVSIVVFMVLHLSPGDPAEITVDAYRGRRFRGHVESLSPATGAKFSLLPPDNATGNFTKVVQRVPVRIRLDEPNDVAHPLRPGMSVVATIQTK